MLKKLSVNQVLTKARSYAKKGEIKEAKQLYEEILQTFSQNIRAQKGLANLNTIRHNNVVQNPPQQVIDQLVNLYNQGQHSVVVKQTQALTKQYPEIFILWNILGASTSQIGLLDDSIYAYKKALSINPNSSEVYSNIGVALKKQGRLDDAIKAFKKSISLTPDYFLVYNNLGNALKDQGRLHDALEAYKKALSLKSDYPDAYSNMGNVFKDQGKLDKAIQAYKTSILLKPNYAEVHYNMGIALNDQGKFDEAVEFYNKALLLKPDYAEAYNNKGLTLQEQGKLDDAIQSYNKALLLKPDYAEAFSNKGLALLGKGKPEESIEAHNKAISLKPDYAEGHFNLSFSLLQTSRVKEGLDEYEWRWKTNKFLPLQRQFLQPIWDGQASLKGKRILVWCEQGIGDTMNWSSCLSLLTSRAKRCILECQEKLVPLLSRSFPSVEVKVEDRSEDGNRDDFDLHLPMGSLYKHFIDEIIKKGNSDSYLVPDPSRVKYWKERLRSIGKGPYIGVCWKSSVKSAYRLQHYPPILQWSPIFKIPDVTFINLQYTDYEDDLAKVQDEFGVTIHNFEDIDQYGNIDEVAALTAALDIVVSTKATPPMISAGVGTPTKIANWRQSNYNTILTNPASSSLEMFHKDIWEPWDKVFSTIADNVVKLKT